MSVVEPEARLWDLVRGALATRAVGIAADLGIAESLAAGPRSAAELAEELGADPDALRRVLRALAADGVFEQPEAGVFENNPTSELLRDDATAAFAHLFGGVWHRVAGELDATGEPSFPKLFGTDFWSWLADYPAERAAFDRAMVAGKEDRVERLLALPWRGDETVVDVGGGNGSLLVSLLERMPGVRGVVFDLPETTRDEEALGERCVFIDGDFFDYVPTGDVYVYSTVVHDWDDASAARILTTLRTHAPSGARALLLEAVMPSGREAHGLEWLDLLLLALCGGRERDETQWRDLLSEAGLEPVRIVDGLIEARCP
jgi:DNA-binding Lrp family transcriptional regulator